MRSSHSRASAKFQPTGRCSLSSRMSASNSRLARLGWALAAAALCALVCTLLMAQQSASTLLRQSNEEAGSKSSGCIACHGMTDSPSMHSTGTVRLGCTDCHGGNPGIQPPAGAQKGSTQYEQAKKKGHPQARVPELWRSSANPVRPYADWLKETKEYIRFVNPGDLRVAQETCGSGGCHIKEVRAVRTSMMTHGAMLWGAALYNNGGFPYKDPHFGESYAPDGKPQRLNTVPLPSQELTRSKGVL